MHRTAVLVLLGALVVGCAADEEPAAPAPTTTAAVTTTTLSEAEREELEAARAESRQFVKEMNRTPSSPRTTTSDERDFDNCVLFNLTILAVMDDYYSGQTDAHTGLASARIALAAMEGLDCGRFSPTTARAMADMDRALRDVGY